MSGLSRRSFLAGSAGAATGVVLLAGPHGASAAGAEPAATDLRARRSVAAAADDASANGVVIHVRDAAAGRVLVMAGEQSIEVEDHTLVQAVAQALRVGEG
jgi:hypothetical protein